MVKPRSQTMPSDESLLQVIQASAPANLKLMREPLCSPMRVSSDTLKIVSTEGSSSSWVSMTPIDGFSLWMVMSVKIILDASRLTPRNCCSPVAVMGSIYHYRAGQDLCFRPPARTCPFWKTGPG